MADVVLSDGREVTFNLMELTLSEYRSLFDKEQKTEDEDEILARVSGLSVEEYRKLLYPDWKRLTLALFQAFRNPLQDPNLLSESIST